MSDLLLDTPDALREQAASCRRLARQTIDPDVVRKLLDYATELEARADDREQERR